MPHVIIKLVSGRSDQQKLRIAEQVTAAIVATADCTEDAVSVSLQDVEPGDWVETVYRPEILASPATLFKKPGYDPLSPG